MLYLQTPLMNETVMILCEKTNVFWRPYLGLLNENKDTSNINMEPVEILNCILRYVQFFLPSAVDLNLHFLAQCSHLQQENKLCCSASWIFKLSSGRCLLEHVIWSLIKRLSCASLQPLVEQLFFPDLQMWLEFWTANDWWSCFLHATV